MRQKITFKAVVHKSGNSHRIVIPSDEVVKKYNIIDGFDYEFGIVGNKNTFSASVTKSSPSLMVTIDYKYFLRNNLENDKEYEFVLYK